MASAVAQAIVDQFMDETLTNERVQADAAAAFYNSEVNQAQADQAVADKAVDDYLIATPSQRAANAVPDARMLQLRQDDDNAHQRTQSVVDKLDQARLDRVALDQTGTAGVRVLDKAEVPTSPSSSKKVIFEAAGVGAVLAVLIVVVGVLALTWLDSTIRGPQEVETILDLRPVGSVPRVS
jgi:capsular polysaccharide biosynthesis protein